VVAQATAVALARRTDCFEKPGSHSPIPRPSYIVGPRNNNCQSVPVARVEQVVLAADAASALAGYIDYSDMPSSRLTIPDQSYIAGQCHSNCPAVPSHKRRLLALL